MMKSFDTNSKTSFLDLYDNMKKNGGWFVQHGPKICLFLIILHALAPDLIVIDFVTVGLLVTAAFIPLIQRITKLKIGELEAEIDSDVKKIEEDYNQSKKIEYGEKDRPSLKDTTQYKDIEKAFSLLETSPPAALAILRMLLEKDVKTLHSITIGPSRKRQPLSRLLKGLYEINILPESDKAALTEVINVCNHAVHGATISKDAAFSILQIGTEILTDLREQILSSSEFTDETIEISQKEEQIYQEAQYKVTTIVPLTEAPYKHSRILNQEALNVLLQGYDEYAEYVISVEKVSD